MSVKIVTDDNFKSEILESNKLALVDFWAEWCGPCRSLMPIIEEIAKEANENNNDEVTFAKMNIDQNPNTPSSLGVRSIPALFLFKNGKHIDAKVGLHTKKVILEWIEECKNK